MAGFYFILFFFFPSHQILPHEKHDDQGDDNPTQQDEGILTRSSLNEPDDVV